MNVRLHSMFRPIQANGRVASDKYFEIMPSPILRPYVSCYWVSEPVISIKTPIPTDGEAIDRVLPDGCTDIIFEHDLKLNKTQIRNCGVLDSPFPIFYNFEKPILSLRSDFSRVEHTHL